MADDVKISYHGDRVAALIEAAAFAGLEEAAEHLLEVSSQLAPHEEGDLANSGTVTTDEADNTAAVSYHRPYAARQHEELTWRHDEGKQAKYLEEPMTTERPVMLRIIQRAVRRATGST
ncbi:MAG TPA: hypothetical protein VFQ15_03575 [Jiangellaceae bacterium]|nr:hypothetical protein [Jiangellaceae bacterium]